MKTWNMVFLSLFGALILVSFVSADELSDETVLPSLEWNGTWQSETVEMVLVQTGNTVTGTYTPLDWNTTDPGVIEGTISDDGKVLSGTWREGGNLTLVLAEDYSNFNGTFTYDYLADHKDSWNGTRMTTIDSGNETGWNGTFESNWYTMHFVQDGNIITVNYEPLKDYADIGEIEGIVSENGTVMNGVWNEKGRFTFNLTEKADSFIGTYGYGDSVNDGDGYTWNGTRIE